MFVSKKVFTEKIALPTVSPTIALRDATRNIYTDAQLAERSLDGGTPVKDKTKKKKKKMTPQKREALLGKFDTLHSN